MSADPHAAAPHGHGHDGHHDGAPHGSRKGYLVGFALSVLLTAVPFAVVMLNGLATPNTAAAICMSFAIVQIVVHMVFFLHMNTRSEGGWTMMALIFTIIIVVIALTGSLWVMYHMNANMMPDMGMSGGM
ncbi:cytochrome o ubiquinol oxidase subunit IV [Sphingomonas metalli]|uniref:Cytochrome bo(3) ubiquinol oxidase subunit 4 n=1 Tax=Sphingomonas metalli TaxID=1779358 RepID=A0A916WWS6_9SPHN|nr:cytochrome o ubiquinol oxidase subunit IV [Sphingomonas metalli]GGB35878.1 cytochrome o ubiquinol oxidase subunit IV [Sphingomonas metalli]